LNWLFYEWPEGTIDSLKARAARQACAAALDGGDAEIARLAFRLAVEEAGNLIGDVDRVHKGADPSCLSLSKRVAPERKKPAARILRERRAPWFQGWVRRGKAPWKVQKANQSALFQVRTGIPGIKPTHGDVLLI
jgi:hypothetical protein